MAVGKVKWFNNAKGFGFINTDAREGKDEDGKFIDFLPTIRPSKWTDTRPSRPGKPSTSISSRAPKACTR